MIFHRVLPWTGCPNRDCPRTVGGDLTCPKHPWLLQSACLASLYLPRSCPAVSPSLPSLTDRTRLGLLVSWKRCTGSRVTRQPVCLVEEQAGWVLGAFPGSCVFLAPYPCFEGLPKIFLPAKTANGYIYIYIYTYICIHINKGGAPRGASRGAQAAGSRGWA